MSQLHETNNHNQRGRALHRSLAAAALATGAMVVALSATPAGAAGPLPSSTTLAVSPKSSVVGTTLTLTATVKVLNSNGLGITPTGSVTFTSTNGIQTVTLGSAPIGSCFLTTCKATLKSAAAPIGTTSATASYPGDSLVGASQGSTPMTVTAPSTTSSNSTVICYAGQPCDTGKVQRTGSTTSADVSNSGSSNTQTLSASVSSQTLHCASSGGDGPDGDGDDDDGVFTGDLVTFSGTATDVGKTLKYTGTGTTGKTMKHNVSEHPSFAGCYGSPTPFHGYTGGVYGSAPFNATDGLYEAQLPSCSSVGNQPPCFTNSSTSTSDTYTVSAPAGDPKYIG
jgi:Big-like domain-containing protein